MAKPLISVVIPCYNQGKYLKDALQSLSICDPSLFETIIVNDGSTDDFTNDYTKELSENGHQVIFQDNQGLGAARNNGIMQSRGDFILPLDADNKVRPEYLEIGIEVLQTRPEVSVVYGNANYFGGKSGLLRPGNFNLQKLMLGNFIDACAVIRKSTIEYVGYYDNMKIMGYEDWDLWLRIAFKDFNFHYVDQTLFDYRVSDNSMMKDLNLNIARQNEIEAYFKLKYADKLDFDYIKNYFIGKVKRRPLHSMYRLVLEKYFPSTFEKQIRNNKIYRGWLYD